MGKQSTINPFRTTVNPLWIALLFAFHPFLVAAQNSVSALAVPLLLPSAVVFDAQGNLYVAETGNHVIRRIDLSGNISTIAGTGVQGFSGDGGLATAAQLDSPQGLAMDAAGDLYIADTHNHRIRRIDAATQIITTIAGTGAVGFAGDGGSATAAQLDLPTALAVDGSGDLFLADSANHRIRRIDAATQRITTVAGTGMQGFSGDNGPATAATIDSPAGLAVDASGNLYLADTHNQRIRRVDAVSRTITTIAGSGAFGFTGDGSATTALALPQGLSFDASGNFYLADRANHRIRRIDAVTGQISTVAGDGTQGYSGDGGPAVAARLDSPRATSLSAGGLVTLADTGNQRVRQLQSTPASATVIQTLGGLGQPTPGILTLAAPSVMAYGTGTITASLTTATAATGNIVLLDTTASGTTTLATIALNADSTVFSAATLPAGRHSITASYSGDATHATAQSTALALTISPQPLQAIAMAATVLYGQPIPTVGGTVTGLLPQDANAVTVTFSTTASSLAPVGAYPITATINGPSAGNYTFTSTAAMLTIAPAPSLTMLTPSAASITAGTAVTLSVKVTSTTSGTPGGTVTLFDAATPIATGPVGLDGSFTFNDSAFTAGSHSLSAVYAGNVNFTGSASAPIVLIVSGGSTAAPDFSLAVTGVASQIIVAGSPASFTFAAQMQSNLSSAINLTATGLPAGATASFNPSYIPPGAANPTVTLTITTPVTQARSPLMAPMVFALLLMPLACFNCRRLPALFVLILLGVAITGCGDRVNHGAQSTSPIASYAITVTGTATSPSGAILSHSIIVTLGVQSSQ